METCPKCGSIHVCWNWTYFNNTVPNNMNNFFIEQDEKFGHECWKCDWIWETDHRITNGIKYEDLKEAYNADPESFDTNEKVL